MMKKFLSKSLVLLLAFLMVFSCFSTAVFAAPADAEPEEELSEKQKEDAEKMEEIRELLEANDYLEYRLIHKGAPNGTDEVVIAAADYDKEKSTADVYLEEYLNEKDVILVSESGDVTWNFKAEKSGNYHIEITYAPVVGFDADKDGEIRKSKDANNDGDVEDEGEYSPDLVSNTATIKRALLLDGEYPFKQSRYLEFPRVWEDVAVGKKDGGTDERGFLLDDDGNEVKPKKQEAPEWRTVIANDSTGYVVEPFLYYIEEGEHTLTLAEVQEVFAVKEIRIFYKESAVSYKDYLKANDSKADKAAGAKPIEIDAERPYRTSSNIIYPIYDRSSAATRPQSAYQIYLNSIGGEKWQTVGNWISWDFEVPADGYYTITPRFLQSFAEGMYVTRSLTIDGETPFAEANSLRFKYGDDWQLQPLSDGVKDKNGNERVLKFYLTKGKHRLEMCVALGDMASIINTVETSLTTINEYYLQILMLAGAEPDEYRDYQFGRLMPEVLKGMKAEAKVLRNISKELEKITGTKGSDSVTLDNVALLLERMGGDEDLIAPNFSELKDYIGNLGTWIMTARNQPLQFDYIVVAPAKDVEKQGPEKYMKEKGFEAAAGFWSSLLYEFKQFIMSWISDYSSYGVRTAEGAGDYETVEVWTTSGRDQSTIMRSLISDSFTPNKRIAVDLKLVAAGSLLPATLSGSGPDVNMSLGSVTVINYAIRSAARPLNAAGYEDKAGDSKETKEFNKMCREIFSDYEEVKSQFNPAALEPLELNGVAYGLPETESFSMLFYRSDILLQHDLSIPRTWDDVYAMLPKLQTNNMDFGYHESLAGLLIMLYQRGEKLYSNPVEGDDPVKGLTGAMSVNLDSNEALETFKEMCELYTMYGFPYSYNFANRFRTGEMPIGVQGYTTYSQLTIFAPELRGLWGFTRLPGTPVFDEDGNPVIDEKTGEQKVNYIADTNVTGIVMMKDCDNAKKIKAAWEFMKWWVSTESQSAYGQEYYALLGASGQYATANIEALKSMSWTADERKELMDQFSALQATPEVPGGYIVARYVEFAFLAAYNDDADPVEAMLEYIDAINAELTRKRDEFGLPTLENYEEYMKDLKKA